jgi:copper chaperone NosL
MASDGLAALLRRGIALGALGLSACAPPEGPQPIVYDREPCAHCRMLISEPRFAAQLESQAGEVLSFDDPGCLLAELATRSSDVRALWFHHHREDRWLDGEHVGFLEVGQSPMGYGLAAVEVGTPGALSLAQARERVAARDARAEGRR